MVSLLSEAAFPGWLGCQMKPEVELGLLVKAFHCQPGLSFKPAFSVLCYSGDPP